MRDLVLNNFDVEWLHVVVSLQNKFICEDKTFGLRVKFLIYC